MKARVKGTDSPFREIYTIEIKGVDGLYSTEDIEFEQEHNTLDHWQDVRERAAIAVLPQGIEIAKEMLHKGGTINEDVELLVASMCVRYADALVKKLKGA